MIITTKCGLGQVLWRVEKIAEHYPHQYFTFQVYEVRKTSERIVYFCYGGDGRTHNIPENEIGKYYFVGRKQARAECDRIDEVANGK